MNDLYAIIEFVKKNATVEKMALARMSLLVGEDVMKITPETQGDQEKIAKFIKAAESVTGKKIFISYTSGRIIWSIFT